MRTPHLFVLPYEEANFVDVHRILWHATHASDLVAIVDDSLFSGEEFLATVDYYKSIGRLDFIDLLPKAGYAMPEEYHVKTACYGRLSSEIGIAKGLNESNIWMLVATIFGNGRFMLLPRTLPDEFLNHVIQDWAFRNDFVEQNMLLDLISLKKVLILQYLPQLSQRKLTNTASWLRQPIRKLQQDCGVYMMLLISSCMTILISNRCNKEVHIGVNMEGRRMRDLESIYLVMMIFLCGLRKISLRSVWRSN
ncbi:hypothetical protein [Ottowia sp. oral taxon 894]|jgi:hypothetical protein|uniref:hypothetical protein n=1 Tax=Ottowia sp. oral taxon 894 TaxID=1658672 RepID=UPI0012E0E5CD|nr:hypothetical protein [Ottowia sp. oral taxon 894]